ncbi:MAG: 1-deoxy-D-xylulose-5-phosphate reductoisomerase [Rikenellaceae bacterium]|jgi:1-deoxy-D-xylulose-5-phosphate reductoisomerase|nr:1-deoxy-D-xylulose-5-phosphate reductoisomerase [Rikenellaceae bacterium]
MERIAVLGSTGSIGEQTLEIIARSEGRFEATVLTANGNWQRLVQQARALQPDSAVIARAEHAPAVRDALSDLPIKVYAGEESIAQVVRGESVDTVVNALVGYAGLEPTLAAVQTGKKLALANKESLVVAGEQVMRIATKNGVPVLPIDSEHSAVLQCLVGEKEVSRLILTASGGPFLDTPIEQLERVTVAQALAHPRWTMGPKITIDSATMINKGFEVIEARWLFGIPGERIDVVVHPQSIVHSMVEFADCSIKAQMGHPDMRLPIQYALYFPERPVSPCERFTFAEALRLDFRPVDNAKFPAVELARECLRRGGTAGAVLNAAGEVAVAAFLEGRIGFMEIIRAVEKTLGRASAVASPSLDDLRAANAEAREIAKEYCN